MAKHPFGAGRVQTARGMLDYLVASKLGAEAQHEALCEDGLYFDDHYLVVVDGGTDKTGHRYGEGAQTGGRRARDLVLETFAELAAELATVATQALPAPVAIVEQLNQRFQRFYATQPTIDFRVERSARVTASVLWVDLRRREVVALGDCKARIDGRRYNDEGFAVDRLAARLRAIGLRLLRQTADDVAERDLGRELILPLLRAQARYRNDPSAPTALQHWVLDGFAIPETKLRSWKLESPRQIELSSDGYPRFPLQHSVEAYERELMTLLERDPLCVGPNRATKGLGRGQVSFDDRALLIWTANATQR